MPKDRFYYAYRYLNCDMSRPRWDASRVEWGVDCLPPTVLARPGVLQVFAANKREALRIAHECHECGRVRPEEAVVSMEVYDSPWQEEPRILYLCADSFGPAEVMREAGEEPYKDWTYYENCAEVLTNTGWADFRYFCCEWCNRMVIRQNPSNGWHSYVRTVNECEEVCLRCYEEELLENGLESEREKLEQGELPGMFFNEGQLLKAGWEQVEDYRRVADSETAKELADKALALMDRGYKVVVDYESMAIGGLEGYVSLWAKD